MEGRLRAAFDFPPVRAAGFALALAVNLVRPAEAALAGLEGADLALAGFAFVAFAFPDWVLPDCAFTALGFAVLEFFVFFFATGAVLSRWVLRLGAFYGCGHDEQRASRASDREIRPNRPPI